MAVLPCSVHNLGERQVVWRRIKDDEFLTIGKLVWSKDHRILVQYSAKDNDVTAWDLIIRHVGFSDAGMYECSLTSAEKVIWHVELKVIDPVTTKPKSRVLKEVTQLPLVTPKMEAADQHRTPDKEEYITAGSPISLKCNFSLGNQSAPRAHLEWYKDGEILQSADRVLVTRYKMESDGNYYSELLIDKSQLADSGEYLCRRKSNDLWLVRIYVLPNTNITSSVVEDNHSQVSAAVNSIQKENGAASSTSFSNFYIVLIACYISIIQTFHVINSSSLLNLINFTPLNCLPFKDRLSIDPT
ncbi:unnamed protein product [Lymnaea stagnalis]|uniref:Ig-like domain-containing protein n=1 Tax=Lymnaea stagnalis TaxID=6523 RepID=A0AAV2I8R4_LYMST